MGCGVVCVYSVFRYCCWFVSCSTLAAHVYVILLLWFFFSPVRSFRNLFFFSYGRHLSTYLSIHVCVFSLFEVASCEVLPETVHQVWRQFSSFFYFFSLEFEKSRNEWDPSSHFVLLSPRSSDLTK
jgi:hypothetical protein